MGISEQLYFPTPVYTGRLGRGPELNPLLLDLIYQERERDSAGTQRSNYRALNGWHSHINLHKEPPWAEFVAAIEGELAKLGEDSGYDPSYRLKVTSMWAIINGHGASNRAHIHPNCMWSGAYYIQTPDSCGDIEFVDPRTMHLMAQPRYIPKKKRKKSRWTKVKFTPEPGKLLIFPSWLYHSVAPNLTSESGAAADRVMISFNVNQQKRR